MAGTSRTKFSDYVRARLRPAPPTFRPPAKLLPVSSADDQGLGHRLASEPQLLDRSVVVRPNTVVVVVPSDQPPSVKRPGARLRPSPVSGKRSYVVVVSTSVTSFDLTLDYLLVLDRDQPLERVKVRVGVQVSDRDDYSSLIKAELLNHTDLDAYLMGCVERELAKRIRDGMTVNWLADLQPSTLERVLADRWVPVVFADGVLLRKSFAVLEIVAEPERADRALHAVPSGRGYPPRDPERTLTLPPTDLDLTMDAGLRRRWSRHVDLPLAGIAGAKIDGRATVIAVSVSEPGPQEHTALRQAYRDYYSDRHVRLVTAVGETYEEIVRAWFRQIDSWPRRLVSIDSDDEAVLRVDIDQGRLSADERAAGVSVGRDSDREALERLLPHERVEFVAADSGLR